MRSGEYEEKEGYTAGTMEVVTASRAGSMVAVNDGEVPERGKGDDELESMETKGKIGGGGDLRPR